MLNLTKKMVLSLDRWVGKVAVVTGASSGIGAAIAERLAEEGLLVVGLARRSERVEELSKKLAAKESTKKGKLYAFKADITKEEDIIKAFNWTANNVGPVSILVNNAAFNQAGGGLLDDATENWKTVLDTNVLGLCIATREAVRVMREEKIDGHIIHINSIAGHRIPAVPGVNIYPASKYAVTALTETLRQELNQIGSKIRITSISPGFVETEMFQDFISNPRDPKLFEMLQKVPRIKPEDIVDSLVYVLSTPPHVQIHELMIQPVGQPVYPTCSNEGSRRQKINMKCSFTKNTSMKTSIHKVQDRVEIARIFFC